MTQPASSFRARLWIPIALIAASLLAMLGIYLGLRELQRRTTAPSTSSALESLERPVPDFEAVDQDGQRRTRDSFLGKVWIAGFVFTRCQGPCPVINMRMGEIQKLLRDESRVLLVSFTVDPAGDTPERLKDHAQTIGATPGKWFFLTGQPEAFQSLIRDGFLTAVQPVEGSDQFIHGTLLAIVDQNGVIRGFYDGLSAETPARVAERVRLLLKK